MRLLVRRARARARERESASERARASGKERGRARAPDEFGKVERETTRVFTVSKPAEGCLYSEWSWKAFAGQDSE